MNRGFEIAQGTRHIRPQIERSAISQWNQLCRANARSHRPPRIQAEGISSGFVPVAYMSSEYRHGYEFRHPTLH